MCVITVVQTRGIVESYPWGHRGQEDVGVLPLQRRTAPLRAGGLHLHPEQGLTPFHDAQDSPLDPRDQNEEAGEAMSTSAAAEAVIDDGPTRGDGGGDPLLGHLGRPPAWSNPAPRRSPTTARSLPTAAPGC